MKYIYSCQTDIGAVREENQDSLLVKSMKAGDHVAVLAAVCDGVGGLKCGEIASRKATELLASWFDYEIPQIFKQPQPERLMQWRFRQLLSDINREIYCENCRIGISSATTLTAILLWDYQYLIGHVGDSRIYRIDHAVMQMTRDHSWVSEQVKAGMMTLEQASVDSRQNIILKCMGGEPEVESDILTGYVREASVFVLCTDGFWHHVQNEEWNQYFSPLVITGQNKMSENLYDLAEKVKVRGENDNITAIAIEVY